MDLARLGPTLPAIARRAVEAWLASGRRPDGFEHHEGPAGGVFVTLRQTGGQLRGCIGSIVPAERTVVLETVRSAVLAATADPRFPPVVIEELSRLCLEVSVLEPPESIGGVEQLDPLRYGVVVRDERGRRGLLLPGIPGIVDPVTQVAAARRKAGIPAGACVALSRFGVHKWSEVAH